MNQHQGDVQPFEIVRAGFVAVLALWGGLNGLDQLLFSLMIIDSLSGLVAAGKIGSINSAVGYVKVRKKVMILLMLGAAHVVDPYTSSLLGALPVQVSLSNAIAVFFATNELISIVENADAVGLPIPPFLRSALAKVNSRDDS